MFFSSFGFGFARPAKVEITTVFAPGHGKLIRASFIGYYAGYFIRDQNNFLPVAVAQKDCVGFAQCRIFKHPFYTFNVKLFQYINVVFKLPFVGGFYFIRFFYFVDNSVLRVVIINFYPTDFNFLNFSERCGYKYSSINLPSYTSSEVCSICMPLLKSHSLRWQIK